MSGVAEPQGTDLDGRTARRERNRAAALSAAHDLFLELRKAPTIEEVAERSGVSLRSLYRYFTDTRRLHLEAIVHRAGLLGPLFTLDEAGEGTLTERIDRYVDHRLSVYDAAGGTIRAVLAVAAEYPLIGERVRLRNEQLREQTRRHFAVELGRVPPGAADEVLDAIELLGQFESMERLLAERGLSRARTRRTLRRAVGAVLAGPHDNS